jgi:hypothetical protein
MLAKTSAIPVLLPRGQASQRNRERAWRFFASAVTALAALCAVLIVSLASVLLQLA